jgi:Mycothiol maleylpyruvate isomerase N-terminal domain
MTIDAVDALRADHASLAALTTELTPSEGSAPSACQGWSVRDVVAHMTQMFRQVVDPTSLPPRDPSGSLERTQDRWVEAMRPLATQDVLDDYLKLGEQAIAVLAGLRGCDGPISSATWAPTRTWWRTLLAFDHYTHIRAGVLAPRGPLRPAVPSAGAGHLGGDGLDGGRVPADERRRARLARRAARPAPHGTWRALGRRRPRRLRPGRRLVVDRGLRAVGDEARGLATVDVRIAGDETTAERLCDTIRVF